MAIELVNAISAYKSAVGRTEQGDNLNTGSTANDFSTMVKSFAQDSIDKSVASEQLSAAAAAGKANIDQVVVAVAEAETTLNTVVAVRDKVLEAYREILRMPI